MDNPSEEVTGWQNHNNEMNTIVKAASDFELIVLDLKPDIHLFYIHYTHVMFLYLYYNWWCW